MRLFIDVDYTLVLWNESNKHGSQVYAGDKYEMNHKLVDAINKFLYTNPETEFLVWSGGGKAYAQEWADKIDFYYAPVTLDSRGRHG